MKSFWGKKTPKVKKPCTENFFRITAENPVEGTSIVTAEGEINIYSAPEFKEVLVQQIDALNNKHIVVDLTETTFLDATALGVLVSARRRLGETGILSVVAVDENFMRIFDITGLDRTLDVHKITKN